MSSSTSFPNHQPLHDSEPISQTLTSILSQLLTCQPRDVGLYLDSLLVKSSSQSTADEDDSFTGGVTAAGYYGGLKMRGDQLEANQKILEKLLLHVKPPPPPKPQVQLDEDGNPIEEEAEEEEETKPSLPSMSNIFQITQTLKSVGIQILSDSERESIAVVLRRFAEHTRAKDLATIRFFGKIFGTIRNYYILECELKPKEDEEEEEEEGEDGKKKEKPDPSIIPAESRGAPGTNRYIYFVSNRLDIPIDQWEELPDVTPQNISQVRATRIFMTGVLDAEVDSHPPFEGTERDYLRAQISRISASTALAPKGYLKLDIEDEEEDEDEDAPPKPEPEVVPIDAYKTIPSLKRNPKYAPSQLDLQSLDSWVHVLPSITHEQNRCAWYKPPKEGEEEEEEEEEDEDGPKKPKEPIEQILPLLAPLSKEAQLVMLEGARSSRGGELITPWSILRSEDDSSTYLVRSLKWPGAYTIAQYHQSLDHITFNQVYIGDGLKFEAHFTPQFVLPVQNEFSVVELKEQIDPTPEEMAEYEVYPPVKVEPPVEEKGEGEGDGEGEEKGEGGEEEEE